jgi:hypothetical protein
MVNQHNCWMFNLNEYGDFEYNHRAIKRELEHMSIKDFVTRMTKYNISLAHANNKLKRQPLNLLDIFTMKKLGVNELKFTIGKNDSDPRYFTALIYVDNPTHKDVVTVRNLYDDNFIKHKLVIDFDTVAFFEDKDIRRNRRLLFKMLEHKHERYKDGV